MIFILAILVAFLILAAQYESWTSPFAVIMGLPIALLGVVIGYLVMNLPISVYTQIGIILLIGSATSNLNDLIRFHPRCFPSGHLHRSRGCKSNLVRDSRFRRDVDDLVGGYTFHAQFLLCHAVFTRTTNPKETEILRK